MGFQNTHNQSYEVLLAEGGKVCPFLLDGGICPGYLRWNRDGADDALFLGVGLVIPLRLACRTVPRLAAVLH